MVDERGRATGEAEGADRGALFGPWIVFLRGVSPRAPRLKAPLLLLVWGLPHRVVAPRQEPKIPRSYARIFGLDGTLMSLKERRVRLKQAANFGNAAFAPVGQE